MTPPLRSLSDEQLITGLKKLKGKEDNVLGEILEHIQEIEHRRLYLSLGYPNLYSYLTQEMGYSENEAYRRLDSARFLKINPELKPLVNQGRLNLTSISEIRTAVRAQEKTTNQIITPAEQVELAKAVVDCSRKETQKILAQQLPDFKPVEFERKKELIDGGVQITIRLTRPQRLKTEKSRDILARKGPVQNTAKLIENLCDFFLRKKDLTNSPSTRSFLPRQEALHKEPLASSRRIPYPIRKAVFRRDAGRCQFKKPDGLLCHSTYNIEIDHVIPVSQGGANTLENLRCLCRSHNQWKADRPAEQN